jgi:hypothetical protein
MTAPHAVRGVRCPFAHCVAVVMLVIERASPGDDQSTLRRVPQHRIVGEGERFGQCPASLMVVPLDDYSQKSLEAQAKTIGLMIGPRAEPPVGIFPVGRSKEHPRRAQHRGASSWFGPGDY